MGWQRREKGRKFADCRHSIELLCREQWLDKRVERSAADRSAPKLPRPLSQAVPTPPSDGQVASKKAGCCASASGMKSALCAGMSTRLGIAMIAVLAVFNACSGNTESSDKAYAVGSSGAASTGGATSSSGAASKGGEAGAIANVANGQCQGSPEGCAIVLSQGSCGDGFGSATCVDGAWTCQAGAMLVSQCGCFNIDPGCFVGTAHGACGETKRFGSCGGGTWNCLGGSVHGYECAWFVPEADVEATGAAGDGVSDANCCP